MCINLVKHIVAAGAGEVLYHQGVVQIVDLDAGEPGGRYLEPGDTDVGIAGADDQGIFGVDGEVGQLDVIGRGGPPIVIPELDTPGPGPGDV